MCKDYFKSTARMFKMQEQNEKYEYDWSMYMGVCVRVCIYMYRCV